MTNDYELMERFARVCGLMHRHQMMGQRFRGPFGSPYRGQGRVLSILRMKPQISQKELGYLLDMRSQSLGELLGKLEKNGYITRTPSEEDRRTANIHLTAEGAAATDDGSAAREEDIFSCLNQEERERLNGYLLRIADGLEERFAALEKTMPEREDWDPERCGRPMPPPPGPHGEFGRGGMHRHGPMRGHGRGHIAPERPYAPEDGRPNGDETDR